MELVLAIDQGTHATRALLYDAYGRKLDGCQVEISLHRPAPGQVEQDADEILQSVRYCLGALLESVPAGAHIGACGLCCQRSSVLAWTRTRGPALPTPCSPVIGWQDTRARTGVEALAPRATDIRR
ncbi:MAG TPA: glycerol kinase, partial [Gammaproteobacteria bacterium]|nr:glycerol kinase [Gammaproteobacteria bacterium]